MSTPEARNSQLRASTSEKIVPTWKLTIGGKSSKELQKELRKGGFDVSYYAQDMLQSRDFTTLKKPEEINLVKVSVSDLGFNDVATTDQIYQAAKERGYELCPPEVGAHLRLADQEQPMGERFSIGMKQITDRHGYPFVFELARHEGGTWLGDRWADPAGYWRPGHQVVFALRPPATLDA